MSASRQRVPVWGILSVAMTPLAWILGALVSEILEAFVDKPAGVSMHSFIPGMTRVVMLSMIGCIAAGVICAFIAWTRRERPLWLPALGLFTTALLIGLFHYLAAPD